jgi:hypothetical protein
MHVVYGLHAFTSSKSTVWTDPQLRPQWPQPVKHAAAARRHTSLRTHRPPLAAHLQEHLANKTERAVVLNYWKPNCTVVMVDHFITHARSAVPAQVSPPP